MSRFHVHLNVADVQASIRFYSELFGTRPTVEKHDYAKWMLEDPKVNFAISTHGAQAGVDHLGIQVDEAGELAELSARLKAAGESTFDQENATCCYARSDKAWVSDPAGLRWETFHTFGEAVTYGEDDVPAMAKMEVSDAACCGAPRKAEPAPACC